MAKVILTLEDDKDTQEVSVNLTFDPPLSDDAEASHAATMAVSALNHLQQQFTGDTPDE